MKIHFRQSNTKTVCGLDVYLTKNTKSITSVTCTRCINTIKEIQKEIDFELTLSKRRLNNENKKI